jgi:DNA-3-methyladenine glycosylase
LSAARALLGSILVREADPLRGWQRRVGRIVEVEAYIGQEDRASHARFGRTARNAVMFGPPGIAYVYLVYGMHDCLNVVTEPEGSPGALLVRAVAPIEGTDAMRLARLEAAQRRRSVRIDPRREAARLERVADRRLASGPGLVAAAFSIDRSDTGRDLCDPGATLRLETAGAAPGRVVAGPRIGIGYAGSPWTEVPWRLHLEGDPSVSSAPRPAGGP